MKTIEVKNNQTLLDIALQYYGTAEAIEEILANNTEIKNDPLELMYSRRSLLDFHPDIKLKEGTSLFINDNSLMMRKTVVKKIENDINTYMAKVWQDQLVK